MTNSKYFFLTDCAPIIGQPPSLHLILSPLNINSFRTTYIFLPQGIMYKNALPLQDCGRACLFHQAMLLIGGFDFVPYDLFLLLFLANV